MVSDDVGRVFFCFFLGRHPRSGKGAGTLINHDDGAALWGIGRPIGLISERAERSLAAHRRRDAVGRRPTRPPANGGVAAAN